MDGDTCFVELLCKTSVVKAQRKRGVKRRLPPRCVRHRHERRFDAAEQIAAMNEERAHADAHVTAIDASAARRRPWPDWQAMMQVGIARRPGVARWDRDGLC